MRDASGAARRESNLGGSSVRMLAMMDLGDWHEWWKHFGSTELWHILLLWWDPIGVYGVVEAIDEYDDYSGQLARMLREGGRRARSPSSWGKSGATGWGSRRLHVTMLLQRNGSSSGSIARCLGPAETGVAGRRVAGGDEGRTPSGCPFAGTWAASARPSRGSSAGRPAGRRRCCSQGQSVSVCGSARGSRSESARPRRVAPAMVAW